MPERLTWEEIVERYPDEWVLVTDIEEDPESPEISSARLPFHSADRDEVDRAAMRMPPPRRIGVFFTGPLVQPGVIFAL